MNKFHLSDVILTMTQKMLNESSLLRAQFGGDKIPLREPQVLSNKPGKGLFVCNPFINNCVPGGALAAVYKETSHKRMCIYI